MDNPLKITRWSPYLVGAGIGVLSWATFFLMDETLGVSTTFVKVAGGVHGAVAPAHVESNGYYSKYLAGTIDKPKPFINWQFALVVMLYFGALLARRLGRDRRVEHVPALWSWRFGPSRWVRYAAAFAGGIVLMFGARMADGCTSGHAISGGLQLAVSSWTFLIFMFLAGLATALTLYGWEGRKHV